MNGALDCDVEQFRNLIAIRLGLQFEDDRLEILSDILERRLAETGYVSAHAYLEGLQAAGNARDELRKLASLLTISETYFFRGADHFRAFSEVAFPERLKITDTRSPVRILSAGCASGDEAYSLAISACQMFPSVSSTSFAITGIDINPVMVAKATKGEYTSWSLRECPVDLREKYFHAMSQKYLLDERIRAMVRFEEANIAVNDGWRWDKERYDIIFCRNVLMYLVPEAARVAVARLTKALAPGGFLFLSHAETLRGISQDFHLRHTHGTFYYQMRNAPVLQPRRDWDASQLPTMPDIDLSWVDAVQRISERIENLSRKASSRTPVGAATTGAAATMKLAAEGCLPVPLNNAVDLFQQEKYQEALGALPDSAADQDSQLLRAVLLTNCGNIAAAEKACQQLLYSDELNAGAHYVAALCREYVRDLDGAIEHDQRAIYLDPAFSMPHLHLALVYRRRGSLDDARRELEYAESLLAREDSSRILLLGSGFSREALIEFCRTQLCACGGRS